MIASNSQDTDLERARTSLRRSLNRYSQWQRQRRTNNSEMRATLKTQLDVISANLEKLDQNLVRIATFGLVSRGKSAVLNALLGQKLLQTGPLHGVTQWPRFVRWEMNPEAWSAGDNFQMELIDTPGLDEVGGEVRGEMAREITRQADLILFVISGDLTRTEYDALGELRKAQKPLILVFNKVDLFTPFEQQRIYQSLQTLVMGEEPEDWELEPYNEQFAFSSTAASNRPWDIVKVAADPAPVQVRTEWPDGRVTQELEKPPAQVEELKQAIVKLLNQDGQSLLALNALVQARDAEKAIARKSIFLLQAESEDLIWTFTKYKALGVALNPIAVLDVVGASVTDLMMIRALARLYGLPMTSFEAGKLLQKILFSSGGLILAEMGSGALMGLGKTAAGLAANVTTYAGVAITQASIAAYGTYTVGRTAQVYLEQGCTWGELGIDTVIQEVIGHLDRDTLVYQLQQEFQR
ncbi:MAG: GTP-binding protein [Microcoleaceae cyanobacterium]